MRGFLQTSQLLGYLGMHTVTKVATYMSGLCYVYTIIWTNIDLSQVNPVAFICAISREIFQLPVTSLKVFPGVNELSPAGRGGHKPQFCIGYNHGHGNEGSPSSGLGDYLNRSSAHVLSQISHLPCYIMGDYNLDLLKHECHNPTEHFWILCTQTPWYF